MKQTGATLEFRWGTVSLPFKVEVPPSLAPGTMTVAQAAGYVGTYTMIMYGGEKHDSTTEQVEIVLKDGRLHSVPATPDMEFASVPSTTKKGVAFPAFLDKGEIQDVEVASPLTWKLKGGRALRFTVAGIAAGSVWFKGKRK